jgi:preprotein translocase subunit YajC
MAPGRPDQVFATKTFGAQPPGQGTRQMLVTPAFAQSGLFGGGSDNMMVQLLPFVLIFVIMYFLILRPQQKRAKDHQQLVKNLRRGDTVITSGGLMGKVTKVVSDDEIEMEIGTAGKESVRVRQVRSMVTGVQAKSEPVKDEAS